MTTGDGSKRGPGRPRKTPEEKAATAAAAKVRTEARKAERRAARYGETADDRAAEGTTYETKRADAMVVQALWRPVSITFLSEVLKQDRKSVTRKLSPLEPMEYHRGNVPLYDFRQALQYLVKPKVDIEQAIKDIGIDDLPASLQKDVWDARLKAQKWRVQAGELWPTEDVLDVLGETFKRLKTTTQLWIDQLADDHSLPVEVRADLTKLVDGLQADLHMSLCELPKERQTYSQEAEVDDGPVSDS